jgi:hypothetical protein
MFFFIIIINFFVTQKIKKPLVRLFLLWSFFPYFLIFFISFFKPVFVPRYLIFAPLGFNLLLFYLLEHIGEKWRWLFIGFIFLIIIHYTALEVAYKRKANIRKTVSEIKKIATKSDYLFVSDSNASSYFAAAYYFDVRRVYLYKETSNKIPYYIGKCLLPENKITSKLPHYPKKAFILDNNYQYRIQSAL